MDLLVIVALNLFSGDGVTVKRNLCRSKGKNGNLTLMVVNERLTSAIAFNGEIKQLFTCGNGRERVVVCIR